MMKILLVEDDPGLRSLIGAELSEASFEVIDAGDVREAITELRRAEADIVVTDLRLPDGSGLDVLGAANALPEHERPAIVVITAFGDIPTAVQALKAGADDFLTKPLDLAHLRLRVERLGETQRLRQRVRNWSFLQDEDVFHSIVGRSAAIREVFFQIRKIAPARGSVLVQGESGVGKELVARAIHAESDRADGPFVAVNCAGIPHDLLESEFFGHREGAFSGAITHREGLFRRAHGGTLLLDEVGDLPRELQAKLLRVLQEGTVRAVGADDAHEIDTRVIAVTNRDLLEDVDEGVFREDLYYRLSTFVIDVPPLRERPLDVELLANKFLVEFSGSAPPKQLSLDALTWLKSYPFPGNVRELQNIIERAVTFCDGPTVNADDLPAEMRANARPLDVDSSTFIVKRVIPLSRVRQAYVEWALEALEGNKKRTAEKLGIGRRTLYRYLDGEDSD